MACSAHVACVRGKEERHLSGRFFPRCPQTCKLTKPCHALHGLETSSQQHVRMTSSRRWTCKLERFHLISHGSLSSIVSLLTENYLYNLALPASPSTSPNRFINALCTSSVRSLAWRLRPFLLKASREQSCSPALASSVPAFVFEAEKC